MVSVKYDEEVDGLYASVSSKKAFFTLELSPRIGVDVSKDKKIVGVEILDASKVLADLFGHAISREKLKHPLCSVSEKDEIYLKFKLGDEHASMALPKPYKSPVLAIPG